MKLNQITDFGSRTLKPYAGLVRKGFYLLSLPGLPRFMQIMIYCLAGIIIGTILFIVRISNAVSYLSDAPLTCINCHIMTDAYASWQRGSHGRVAVCIDCHLPHDNIVGKYAFKAFDGGKHSAVFTMRKEPQILHLSTAARPVVQQNCLRCHQNQFVMISLSDSTQQACWNCHSNIHGEAQSLSASPETLRPKLPKAGLNIKFNGDKTDEQDK